MDEDELEEKPENIYESIKRKSELQEEETTSVNAIDHSDRLKNLLRKMN